MVYKIQFIKVLSLKPNIKIEFSSIEEITKLFNITCNIDLLYEDVCILNNLLLNMTEANEKKNNGKMGIIFLKIIPTAHGTVSRC